MTLIIANEKAYLTVPLMITLTKRGMKKVGQKGAGKVCGEALKKSMSTANSVGPNAAVNSTSTLTPKAIQNATPTSAPQVKTDLVCQPRIPVKPLGSKLLSVTKTDNPLEDQHNEQSTPSSVNQSYRPQEFTTEKLPTPALDQFFKVSVPSRNPVENPSTNNSSASSSLDTSVNSGSIQSTSSSGQQFGVFGHAQSTGTRVTTQQTVTVPSRGMASVHGGRYTEPSPKVVPTLKQTQQEETHNETGVHKIIVVVRCNHEDCLKTDCANDEITPCNIPQEKHQEEFSQKDLDKNKLVLQSAGNTTSSDSTKLPDKQVVQVDANKNYTDQPKAQNAVIEQTTVSLNADKFQEQKKVTAYLQHPDRSAIILTTLNTNTADETI